MPVTDFPVRYQELLLRGFLHRPVSPNGHGLVITHGAGANCETQLLKAIANAFGEAGIAVLRFDLPFRQLRANGPPRPGSAERDQAGIREAVSVLRKEVSGNVFIGGHSYGGRQASMLAALDASVADGLVLFSYPLHPPKRADQMRTAHFPKLETPALFFSGARDGFGTPEEMRDALKLIPGRTRLVTIEGAGHELMSSRNQVGLMNTIVEEFRQFYQVTDEREARP